MKNAVCCKSRTRAGAPRRPNPVGAIGGPPPVYVSPVVRSQPPPYAQTETHTRADDIFSEITVTDAMHNIAVEFLFFYGDYHTAQLILISSRAGRLDGRCTLVVIVHETVILYFFAIVFLLGFYPLPSRERDVRCFVGGKRASSLFTPRVYDDDGDVTLCYFGDNDGDGAAKFA